MKGVNHGKLRKGLFRIFLGGFNIFFEFSAQTAGEDVRFDYCNIFQMGGEKPPPRFILIHSRVDEDNLPLRHFLGI